MYLFRGRNYNYRTRPQYPLMLWKPAAPVYPKLIQEVPEGLTKDEAHEFRVKGKSLKPICKLCKFILLLKLWFSFFMFCYLWALTKVEEVRQLAKYLLFSCLGFALQLKMESMCRWSKMLGMPSN